MDWQSILGWGNDEMEELRLVGYAYLKQGKYDIATQFFETLCMLLPDSAYDLQTLGALHLQVGNHLESLQILEKAIKVDPSHAPTLLNRAKVLFALGYKQQALAQTRALEHHIDPEIANLAQALLLAYQH